MPIATCLVPDARYATGDTGHTVVCLAEHVHAHANTIIVIYWY